MTMAMGAMGVACALSLLLVVPSSSTTPELPQPVPGQRVPRQPSSTSSSSSSSARLETSAARWKTADFYGQLRVPPSASPADIVKSFRRISKKLKSTGDAEGLAQAAAAFAVLRDPAVRKQYDDFKAGIRSTDVPFTGAFSAAPGFGGDLPARHSILFVVTALYFVFAAGYSVLELQQGRAIAQTAVVRWPLKVVATLHYAASAKARQQQQEAEEAEAAAAEAAEAQVQAAEEHERVEREQGRRERRQQEAEERRRAQDAARIHAAGYEKRRQWLDVAGPDELACVVAECGNKALVAAAASGSKLALMKLLRREDEEEAGRELDAVIAGGVALVRAVKARSGNGSNGGGSTGDANIDGGVETWTAKEQTALEAGLQTFPSSMDKKERWAKISQAVGTRTRKQCVARYKHLKEKVRAAEEAGAGKR